MDPASQDQGDDDTAAKEPVFGGTHTPDPPWTIVNSNDKRRARLAANRQPGCTTSPARTTPSRRRSDPLIVRPRCTRTPTSGNLPDKWAE